MVVTYRLLCEKFYGPYSAQTVNEIKGQFREAVDSNRSYDRIYTIEHLIQILERRDCLNEENLGPLEHIAMFLQRTDVLELIYIYKATVTQPIDNRQPEPAPAVNAVQVLPNIARDPIQRIDDIIAEEIGNSWKSLGRAMKVPEGYIDSLERQHRRIQDIAYELLNYHRATVDERMWKVELCKALQKARRNDLAEKIMTQFAVFRMM